jgi:hypothetical protein
MTDDATDRRAVARLALLALTRAIEADTDGFIRIANQIIAARQMDWALLTWLDAYLIHAFAGIPGRLDRDTFDVRFQRDGRPVDASQVNPQTRWAARVIAAYVFADEPAYQAAFADVPTGEFGEHLYALATAIGHCVKLLPLGWAVRHGAAAHN